MTESIVNTIPHDVENLIHQFINPNDFVNLSISCSTQYWVLWNYVGCYTHQLQINPDDFELYDQEDEKDYKKAEKEYRKGKRTDYVRKEWKNVCTAKPKKSKKSNTIVSGNNNSIRSNSTSLHNHCNSKTK